MDTRTIEEHGYWYKLAESGKSPSFKQCILILGVHLLLGIGAAVAIYFLRDKFAELLEDESISVITGTGSAVIFALSSAAVFQTVYFFCLIYRYRFAKCPECGKVFTTVEVEIMDEKSGTVTQYKDDSSAYGKRREVTRFATTSRCKCINCGVDLKMVETGGEVSSWEEIKP